jgi:methanogenic corrinoid protein MtbC1
MVNMEKITKEIKEAIPGTMVAVGGAPVNKDYGLQIGADAYSPDLQGLVEILNQSISA